MSMPAGRTGFLTACILTAFFINCEESGPTGGFKDATLPGVKKLVGTYSLDRFHVAYDDGKSLSDASPNVSFSGSMTITKANRITQDVTLNNVTVHMTADIISAPDDSTLRVSSQKKSYNILIRFSSPVLVTVLDAHAIGGTFVETDTWTRTSTAVWKRPDGEGPVALETEPLGGAAAAFSQPGNGG